MKLNAFGKTCIALMLIVAFVGISDWQEASQKQEEKNQAEQLHVQQLQEFKSNRATILSDARQYIKNKAYSSALDVTSNYAEIDDSELQAIRTKAREMLLYGKTKKLPASDLTGNIEGYTKLLTYSPENPTYKKKLAHYQNQLNAWKKKIAPFGPKPKASAWDGHYYAVEHYLDRTLKDPESLEWEGCTECYTNETGWLVGCEYRAKNSFGGYVREARWFTIRGGQVVNVEMPNAYKF